MALLVLLAAAAIILLIVLPHAGRAGAPEKAENVQDLSSDTGSANIAPGTGMELEEDELPILTP